MVNVPENEYPDGFDRSALKELVMMQKALKIKLKEQHCARMEALGKDVTERAVKLELQKSITEDFREQNKEIMKQFGCVHCSTHHCTRTSLCTR